MNRVLMTALAAVATLATLASCAHGHDEEEEVVGSSHARMSAPSARGDAASGSNDPQLPDGWRTSFAQVGALTVSRGHGTASWPETVYADPVAAKALRERTDAPAGSMLVAVHPGTKATGELLFVMEKVGNEGGAAWHYRVGDATGVTRDPPACQACHALAPSDHLFIIDADGGAGR